MSSVSNRLTNTGVDRSPLGLVRRADHTCHNQPYYLVRDRLNIWMR